MIPAPDHFSLVGTRHRKTPGFTMGRTRFSFASGIQRSTEKIREAGNSSAYRSRLTFPAFNSANLPFPRGSTRITHLFAHCRYILARPRHYRTPYVPLTSSFHYLNVLPFCPCCTHPRQPSTCEHGRRTARPRVARSCTR